MIIAVGLYRTHTFLHSLHLFLYFAVKYNQFLVIIQRFKRLCLDLGVDFKSRLKST